MRNNRPFIFTNIRQQEGVDEIINWIKTSVLLENIQWGFLYVQSIQPYIRIEFNCEFTWWANYNRRCVFYSTFKDNETFFKNNWLLIMLISVSAGLMSGDAQLLNLHIKKIAKLNWLANLMKKFIIWMKVLLIVKLIYKLIKMRVFYIIHCQFFLLKIQI